MRCARLALLGFLAVGACGHSQPQLQTTTRTTSEPGLPPGERPATTWESSISVPDEKASSDVWHSLAPGLPGQPPSTCQSFRSTRDNQATCQSHCADLKNQGLSPCTCTAGPCPK